MACAEAGSKASATTGAMKVGQRIEGSPDGSRCSARTIAWVFIAPGAGVLPAEDGQRLADMSACTVSGTVACVLIPGSVAS